MIHNPEIFNKWWPQIQFALDPKQIISNEPKLKSFFEHNKDNYAMIAIGKGSSAFANEIFDQYFPTMKYICLDNNYHSRYLEIKLCDHPLPTKRNLINSKKVIDFFNFINPRTPILTIVTGGSSAMLCSPINKLKLTRSVYSQLLSSGFSIDKINTIRKHSDLLKGGHLAKLYYPRKSLNLYVSDVDNDNISLIGSGPTVLDDTTQDDTELILKQQKIKDFALSETPKDGKYFSSLENKIIYTREQMLSNIKKLISTGRVHSNHKLLSADINNIVLEVINRLNSKDSIYLFSGESRVKVTGRGRGGRCAHLALALLSKLKDQFSLDIISFATDGIDNSEYAGVAFSSKDLFRETSDKEIYQYLNNFDSYSFFKKYNCTIKTGPLPVNVSDLLIISH